MAQWPDETFFDPDNERQYLEPRAEQRRLVKGLWAYRFRSRYYIRHNSLSSHPNSLGVNMLGNIPDDPEKYLEWKARRIEQFVKLEEKLNRGESLSQRNLEVKYIPPLTDFYMNWTYVIDLDRDIFTVNESAHFNLLTVPRGPEPSWIPALKQIGSSITRRVISEDFPKEFTADIRVRKPEPNSNHIKLYRDSNPRIVSAGTGIFPLTVGNKPGEQLGRRLFLDFIVEYAFYFDEVYQWSPQDEPFQQIAFGILSLACGCYAGYNFMEPTLDQTRIFGPDRVPRWEYPKGDRYWLPNGVWVLLKTHLDDELQVESAVGEVIFKAQNEGLAIEKPFRAILFSIEHVVLIKVAKGGEVSRTAVLKAYVNYFLDNDEGSHGIPGYGKRQPIPFGDISDINLPHGFDILLRYFASQFSDGEGQINPARLPVELICQIFEYLDPSTRQSFFNTSRLFRQVTREYPTFGRYILNSTLKGTQFLALDIETAERLKVFIANYPIEELSLSLGVCLKYGKRKRVGLLCYFLVPNRDDCALSY